MGAKWFSLLFQKTTQQAGETPPRHSRDAGSTPAASTSKEFAMRWLLQKLYLMWAALVAKFRRLEDGPEWEEWERASLEDLWAGDDVCKM